MKQKEKIGVRCLTATHLRGFALLMMLLDHMWGTLPGMGDWMTCLGRLAFPVFAFQLAEGYDHTKHFKKYLLRMFLFALAAEIPYNLMVSGYWLDPFAQNVMFTFCWALLLIRLMDKGWKKHWAWGLAASAGCLLLGYLVGMFTFVDYHGEGVVLVLLLWLLRKLPEPWRWVAILAALVYVNCFMLKGLTYHVELFGWEFSFPQQGFAVFSVIPLWLYGGKRGLKSRAFQYGCYAFYPVHMLLLSLIGISLMY